MGASKRKGGSSIDPRVLSRVATFAGVLFAIVVTVAVWVLYQPGRHTHARFLSERTAVRLSFQPSMIQDYITSLAPGITRFVSTVPKFTSMQARAFKVDWIHALPYEITILVEHAGGDDLGVLAYVNPIPDNDSFVGEVNGWGALGRIPAVRWTAPRLAAAGEQQYTAKGTIAAPGTPPGGAPITAFDGGHLIEFSANNGAVLLALYRAFGNSFFAWASAETDAALTDLLPQIAGAALTGELTRADELTLAVEVQGGTADRNALAAAVQGAGDELGMFLGDEGMSLVGEGAWVDSKIYRARWQFSGFEAKIRQVWRR